MRKQDLKVGEEYAVGSVSRYDRFNLAHARVLSLDGEGTAYWGRKARGIVVVLVEKFAGYRYRGEAGREFVLDSARDIQRPWAEYAEARARNDANVRARDAERDRCVSVALDVEARLHALGVRQGVHRDSDGTFTVWPDTMAQIVALIPEPATVEG